VISHTPFAERHIGPNAEEKQKMLQSLGCSSEAEFMFQVIPDKLMTKHDISSIGPGLSEFDALKKLKAMMSQNKLNKSYIGMGFYETVTPPVIQRNILENPAWYTAYTPYQAEISQGRLESLLNFQTMVCDLTKMDIANASMLDEGSACAEALTMAINLSANKSGLVLLDEALHPHVIDVAKTRLKPLGISVEILPTENFNFSKKPLACVVAYPNTRGEIRDLTALTSEAKVHNTMVIADVDLMALALITPPGEWGADIVVGNTQRFGVPLGNGGPHAAFLATKEAYKRQLPGRLIGVSIDQSGKRAYRLTLQTREQHIRREKATSNICTAQVLLANMAAMYAVYHGPKGIKKIATEIHKLTQVLSAGLDLLGLPVRNMHFFDTLYIPYARASELVTFLETNGINIRLYSADEPAFGISIDETTNLDAVFELLKHIANATGKSIVTKETLEKVYQSLALNTIHLPSSLLRTSEYLTHPVFNRYHSETEMLRYITSLQNKDVTLANSMIALGSCTMKLNATSELMPLSWPEVSQIHPFAPANQMKGYLDMIADLEHKLCEITGFSKISFQPNSGAQGEYAGLLVIKKYHESRGDHHRNICLIPSSAHGTNPASAVMAGLQVVVVACDSSGNIDINDLKKKAEAHKSNLAALMVTYPSTHGVFEESIKDICNIIHEFGGQVYMDGANLNALVGWVRPAELGADVSHMNLHKTFAIPHGGGGPGVGPIGVKAHLAPFLPSHRLQPLAGPEGGVGSVTSSPWGSASILTISWMYITMMGGSGLKEATYSAILGANYISKQLESDFTTLYRGQNGRVAHECILDFRPFKSFGVEVVDIAKRLIDFGFHAPTMSWPVAGTLMVEPTESESKEELDRFIQAMKQIRSEIRKIENGIWPRDNNPLKNAPHTVTHICSSNWDHPYTREEAAFPLPWVEQKKYWSPVRRVNDAFGDRNIVCTCPPLDEYQ